MMQTPFTPSSANLTVGAIGSVRSGNLATRRSGFYPPAAGVLQQVDVVTVPATVDNAATYTIRVTSTTSGLTWTRDYSYLTAATTGSVAMAALIALLLADPELGILITEVQAVTATTFRIRWAAGRTGTITFPSNATTTVDLSVANTAAGFPTFTYGRVVELLASGGVQAPDLSGGPEYVWTVTTTDEGETTTTYLSVNGVSRPVTATAGASEDLTVAALAAAVAVAYPEATVASETVTDTVTATFPRGTALSETSPIVNTASLVVSGELTAATAGPIRPGLVTLDERTAPVESLTGPTDVTGPRPGTGPKVDQASGLEFVVAAPSTSLAGSTVYYDDDGILYDAAGEGRAILPGASWLAILDTERAALVW